MKVINTWVNDLPLMLFIVNETGVHNKEHSNPFQRQYIMTKFYSMT